MTQNRVHPAESDSMTPLERRATVTLAGIISLRMLGLFMILPVFSLYAEGLTGATPLLIGLGLGAYGLTQSLLQIPFGMLSDRIGRKPVITGGLLLFAMGSIVAGSADTITWVILGRALQGAGAISAATMALTADLTRDEHRSKAMATIGVSIGMSFAIALVAGPVISNWIGVSGIFWLTAVLALLGIAILHLGVPQPLRSRFHRDTEAVPTLFKRVLADRELLRLDFGIFVLHMIVMSCFVVLPLILRDRAGLDPSIHWRVYLPVLVISMALMVPFLIYAERKRRVKPVFVGAIAVLGLAQTGLALWHHNLIGILVMMVLLLAAFNLLEATLPSLISRIAHAEAKGTALGVYSTSQFLGAFIGGTAGGWLYGVWGFAGVFWFTAISTGFWVLLAISMKPITYLTNRMLTIGNDGTEISAEQARNVEAKLRRVSGVAEAIVIAEEGLAYLKVERHNLDTDALHAAANPGTEPAA